MAHFVAAQSGAFNLTSTWVGGVIPSILGGDTFETSGFDITDVAGIFGDDTTSYAIHINNGSVTLSGDTELRPASVGIRFAGGTFNQGDFDYVIAPTLANSGARLASFENNAGAATSWTTAVNTPAHCTFDNSRGASHVRGFGKEWVNTFLLYLDWYNMWVDGIGDGLVNHFTSDNVNDYHIIHDGDRWRWYAGGIRNCGQFDIRLAFSETSSLDWNGRGNGTSTNQLAIGWWPASAGWNADRDNKPIKVVDDGSPTTGLRNIKYTVWYTPNVADTILFPLNHTGNAWDASGNTLINCGLTMSQNVGCDYSSTAVMSVAADAGLGVAANATADDLTYIVVGGADNNPHGPLYGENAAYVSNGLIVDGLTPTWNGTETGDIICTGQVTFNNALFIHGAGHVNPSLSTTGRVSINRATFHNACGIGWGESQQVDGRFPSLRNILHTSPVSTAALLNSLGGTVTQTTFDCDYIAYLEAEQDVANLAHPVLTGPGYIANSTPIFTSDTYGTNDVKITGDPYVDSTRHGLTWAASLGYAETPAGVALALLAGAGVNTSGVEVAVDTNSTIENYRAYITAGYAVNDATLDGAGEAGVDIGAFDYVAASVPPVISTPTETPSETSSVIGVTTDTASGTLYAVVSTTEPNYFQIENGLDSAGAATINSSAVVSDLAPEVTLTGLDASSTYNVWLFHQSVDGNSNKLNISTTTTAAAPTQTVTVTGITGGESLSGLDYAVFAGHDLSTMTLLTQGAGETTDVSGNLVIDLDGTGVVDGDPLIIIIGDWTTAPTGASRAAVCYANASVG